MKKALLFLVGACALVLLGAAPAAAAPAGPSAGSIRAALAHSATHASVVVQPSVSCYGGAVGWSFTDTATLGPYTTTSRCADINMRTTNGEYTYACVVFIDHTGNCNYVTLVGPSWTTIATNVKDGTHFTVPVASLIVGDHVTGQLAF